MNADEKEFERALSAYHKVLNAISTLNSAEFEQLVTANFKLFKAHETKLNFLNSLFFRVCYPIYLDDHAKPDDTTERAQMLLTLYRLGVIDHAVNNQRFLTLLAGSLGDDNLIVQELRALLLPQELEGVQR